MTEPIAKPTHRRFRDLEGIKFGRLTVLSYAGAIGHNQAWIAVCECGTERSFRASGLIAGTTKSCGCLKKDLHKNHFVKHGDYKSAEYSTWIKINERCRNKNWKRFKDYGGRGIVVCERWRSYENFLKDMGRKPSPKHSIDRIDNNGNYEPSNCKWATPKEQNRNTRRNVNLTYGSETKCIAEWAEQFGINPGTLRRRIKSGWSVERALKDPLMNQ